MQAAKWAKAREFSLCLWKRPTLVARRVWCWRQREREESDGRVQIVASTRTTSKLDKEAHSGVQVCFDNAKAVERSSVIFICCLHTHLVTVSKYARPLPSRHLRDEHGGHRQ